MEKPQWMRSDLYLGMKIPAGGEVSEKQFSEFVNEVITCEFPEGMTIYDAYGQMQEEDGVIVKQPTKVITIVHENSKAKADSIEKIASLYRSKFGDPQVMRTTSPVGAEFFSD